MIDKNKELPEPWYWTDQDLSYQLQKELSQDHSLKFKKTKTLARREDNDDVLFELDNGEFAIVHLTWQSKAHESSDWPTMKKFKDWTEVAEKIAMDAADFQ